jgi:endo-1,4-beta-xylanase
MMGFREGFHRSKLRVVLAALTLLVLGLALACGGAGGGMQPPPRPEQTLRQAAARHNILIGAAAFSPHMSDAPYASILGSEFSQLEPENEMKFGFIHPRPNTDPQPYDFAAPDSLVAFAQAHNMVVRGHTIVWHQEVPAWVTSGGFSAGQLAAILQDHTATVISHYGPQVYAWDVVNEAFNDDGTLRSTIWYDQPGIGYAGMGTAYIEQVFQWAASANPNAKLFYNDYNAETVNAKSDAIYNMAADFKNRGVPLDGIGFQMHLTLSFDNPATLASFTSNLQRFAALGLDLHITELDVRLPDGSTASLNAEAELYRKVTAICVQNPSCKVIQTWGVTDKYSWIPGSFPGFGWGLLWSDTYQKKPAYFSVRDALNAP